MSGPKFKVQQTTNIMRGMVREFNTITETASKTDKDGDWGLDAWIRVIHELVDLQVRTSAAVVQVAISGPWWTDPPDDDPQPSDPVTVDQQRDYPRKLTAASAFVRVGLPQTTIPAGSIGFDPEKLPANATEFRVVLKDQRFVGSNYEGTVVLTHEDDPNAEPDTQRVTVGL